jgi:hypothetical protein
MGSLVLSIEEAPSGRQVGCIGVDTRTLDVGRPAEASLPLLDANQQTLGTADVRLAVTYSQLLSSFEMAEHLASADRGGLPLYPLPAAAVSNHINTSSSGGGGQHHHQQVQGPPAVASVVSGTVSAAPAATAAAAGGSTSAAGGMEQAASSSGQQAGLVEQHQQQENTPPPQELAVAGAAGEPADPLLEVIRKAEQLKASLDQAARAGVLLGLLPPAIPQQQQQLLSLPWHVSGSSQPNSSSIPLLQGLLTTAGAGANGGAGVLHPLLQQQGTQGSLLSVAELLAALAGSPPPPAARLALPSIAEGHAATAAAAGGHSSSVGGISQHPHHSGSSSEDSSERHTSTSDAGSSSSGGDGSSLLSELADLDELEDLLLQELLAARYPARDAGDGGGGSSKRSPDRDRRGQAATAAAGGAAGGAAPMLRVEVVSLAGFSSPAAAGAARLTAVVKSSTGQKQQLDVTRLLAGAEQQSEGSCTVAVAAPASLAGAAAPAERACIAVELWAGDPSAAAGDGVMAASLLGIAQVPLTLTQQGHPAGSSAAAGASDADGTSGTCVAAGCFQLHDVLAGGSAGSLELRVLLLQPQAAASAAAAASPAVPTAAVPAAAEVVAVRHVIDVTLAAASGLPNAAQLSASGCRMPDSRFVRYSFPGVCG